MLDKVSYLAAGCAGVAAASAVNHCKRGEYAQALKKGVYSIAAGAFAVIASKDYLTNAACSLAGFAVTKVAGFFSKPRNKVLYFSQKNKRERPKPERVKFIISKPLEIPTFREFSLIAQSISNFLFKMDNSYLIGRGAEYIETTANNLYSAYLTSLEPSVQAKAQHSIFVIRHAFIEKHNDSQEAKDGLLKFYGEKEYNSLQLEIPMTVPRDVEELIHGISHFLFEKENGQTHEEICGGLQKVVEMTRKLYAVELESEDEFDNLRAQVNILMNGRTFLAKHKKQYENNYTIFDNLDWNLKSNMRSGTWRDFSPEVLSVY